MNSIKVKLYGKFKDLLNQDEIILDFEDEEKKIEDIISQLEEIYNVKLMKLIFNTNRELNHGILILKNDKDYSIFPEVQKKIKNGDILVFLSSIHGG